MPVKQAFDYLWLPMMVPDYNDVLERHGGTFLITSDDNHIEVWEVTHLADATYWDDPDQCSAQVYFFPAHFTADDVSEDIRSGGTYPDREEMIGSIDELWGTASHFMMGYHEPEKIDHALLLISPDSEARGSKFLDYVRSASNIQECNPVTADDLGKVPAEYRHADRVFCFTDDEDQTLAACLFHGMLLYADPSIDLAKLF